MRVDRLFLVPVVLLGVACGLVGYAFGSPEEVARIDVVTDNVALCDQLGGAMTTVQTPSGITGFICEDVDR